MFPVVDPSNGIMAMNTIDMAGILRDKEIHLVLPVAATRTEPVFSIIKSLNLHSSPLMYVRVDCAWPPHQIHVVKP